MIYFKISSLYSIKILLMKFDILDCRWIVTFENKIFVIYNLFKYLVSKTRTTIVDFNFQVSRLNFGLLPPFFKVD